LRKAEKSFNVSAQSGDQNMAAKKTTKKIAKKKIIKKAVVAKSKAKPSAKSTKPKAEVKKKTAPKKTAAAKKPTAAGAMAQPKYKGPLARVGQPVPDLTLPGTSGDLQLSSMQGRKVVLYFYPKDATPGCTIEGKDFSRLREEFLSYGTEVYGVSRDSIDSHEDFRVKENYSVHLLSDVDEVACRMFDVIKMKNMYGKQVRGIERSTFVIDEDGKLIKEWRKVSVPGHAEAVLDYVQSLE
jgi:peroxiredoxin Q/BCP